MMLTPLHQFLTTATQKAADEIEAAYLRLPEEKRHWSPGGTARSAADMMAECAVMNDLTEIIQTRRFPADFDYAKFQQTKAALMGDWDTLRTQLHASTARGIAALQTIPASDLEDIIEMPWANYTLAEIMAYPYWNMSYHLGQINALAAQLEAAG
jgi:uncharacterized damage-inducible protein DinB